MFYIVCCWTHGCVYWSRVILGQMHSFGRFCPAFSALFFVALIYAPVQLSDRQHVSVHLSFCYMQIFSQN